jgi:hypothetical protein
MKVISRVSRVLCAAVIALTASISVAQAEEAPANTSGAVVLHPVTKGSQGAGYVPASAAPKAENAASARYCGSSACLKSWRCYNNKGAMTSSCLQSK